MSSYNQVEETRALGEMLSMAVVEIVDLHDDMSDLCAGIAAQFPETHERIPKYQEAYDALASLESAKAVLDEPMNRVAPSYRQVPVVAFVGRQTRQGRITSQRVRLGNAVVRLKAVRDALTTITPPDIRDVHVEELVIDLDAIIADLQTVTFPTRYG